MQSHLLRSGVQHRLTLRRYLYQHVRVWSARGARLRRRHIDGEPGTNGTSMDRMCRTRRLMHLQLSVHPDDPVQSVFWRV